MTTRGIWRLRCDGSDCTHTAIVDNMTDTPDGWTQIRSTAHLDGKPPLSYGRGRSRRTVSTSDLTAGSFTLHLCPQHPDTFAGHLPATQGAPRDRGDYRRRVAVDCSCGYSVPIGAWDGHVVGQQPALVSEFRWWQHLPDELKGYARRDFKTAA